MKLKRGFTDILYALNFISVQVIVIAVIYCTLMSGTNGITDMSALATIPPAAYGELALHTGFIIWKAKSENMSKYGNKANITMEV